MNRRGLLRGVALAGSVGYAGCGSDDDEDNFRQLDRVVVRNENDSSHGAAVALYRAADRDRPDPDVQLVRRRFDLSPDESGYLTEFDGSASQYVLDWTVDDGERQSHRTDDLDGCTVLTLAIESDDRTTVSSDTGSICY